ncbi:hypothetical protein F0562_020674 [Nyssa sinensis]|uniref:Uncharacterized protein n=1 Tax=Nyssa sinensis TaxID=561372 RepID=A0A5J5BS98_9ASTE|nr:hypothetical protein F0562_020674 [Nyssa sinensis]
MRKRQFSEHLRESKLLLFWHPYVNDFRVSFLTFNTNMQILFLLSNAGINEHNKQMKVEESVCQVIDDDYDVNMMVRTQDRCSFVGVDYGEANGNYLTTSILVTIMMSC